MDSPAIHNMLDTIVIAIAAGVLLIALAKQIRVAAIVLLLIGGVVLGPQFLGLLQPESLGDGLRVIISLAVGLILFEGGLTLDLEGYRKGSKLIRRLLSVGVVVTWLGVALAIRLIFGYSIGFCLLAASLVVVTGPTVIGPLLKRIKVLPQLHNVLHWEGVLIDPLGVFIALMCYEWIVGEGGAMAMYEFTLRVLESVPIGIAGGLIYYWTLKNRWVPEDMINVCSLAFAVAIFGIAEALIYESGLLAVTVCGFVLGMKRPIELRQIRTFKAELTDLLIGMLFMLLASRLEIAQFLSFGIKGVLIVAIVMVVIRPLSILASSWGLGIPWREKAFLSWVAPRGIVAASMASLFALSLEGTDRYEDPQFLETFTYSVIIATVMIQGFTAGPLAALLNLKRPAPNGWAIIGAHKFGRRLGHFFGNELGVPVKLIDVNAKAVRAAREEGLDASSVDARDASALSETFELEGIGNLLAITDNEDLNILLCQRWVSELGRDHVFRWDPPGPETQRGGETAGIIVWPNLPKPSLLSAELERGEATLLHAREVPTSAGGLTTVLAAKSGPGAVLDPVKRKLREETKLGEALILRRRADYLIRSLSPELALRIEGSVDLEGLFTQLVQRVVDHHPGIPLKETVSELLDREKAFPTALGHGVAVPHAYSSRLDTRLCVLAQIPGGVDFDAPDGEMVRLAFLLLSPSGDPEGHLATMGEIARACSDAETRTRLFDATDPADLIVLLNRSRGNPASNPS